MDNKLKWFRFRGVSLIVGIMVIFFLASCTPKPPCQIDFSQPKKPPKPKPVHTISVTQQQLRNFYLCQLQTNGVYVIHVGETWRLIFPSDDVFENETDTLNPYYQPVLKIAANFLKLFSKINVKIAAYSDDTDTHLKTKFGGSIKDVLTTAQAEAVAMFLQKQRIHARLLYAAGEDGRHPIAWNGSELGRQFNRRVEISFRSYHNNIAWY